MSKRSWPRARSRASTGRLGGSAVASALPCLPWKKSGSVSRCPRATVPSGNWRADMPSAKNFDSRSGRYLGWLCMSCRQPAADSAASASIAAERCAVRTLRRGERSLVGRALPAVFVSILNFGDLRRVEAGQETPRLVAIEAGVARLDAEEVAIARREAEARRVEHRVVRRGQAVE